MVMLVRQRKGRKDRLVPLSARLLAELRVYWQDRVAHAARHIVTRRPTDRATRGHDARRVVPVHRARRRGNVASTHRNQAGTASDAGEQYPENALAKRPGVAYHFDKRGRGSLKTHSVAPWVRGLVQRKSIRHAPPASPRAKAKPLTAEPLTAEHAG